MENTSYILGKQTLEIVKCFIHNAEKKSYGVVDSNGLRYGAMRDFPIGKHEVDVYLTPDGKFYNIRDIKSFTNNKPFTPAQKDWSFEKKKVALESALKYTEIKKGDLSSSETLLSIAENILGWINKN